MSRRRAAFRLPSPARSTLRAAPAAALVVLAAVLSALPAPAAAQQAQARSLEAPPRPFLFKDARGELAQARARGEEDALVVIASTRGENVRVAGMIADMGGTVQYRADEVDYIRARVPIDEIEALAAHDAVHSLEISIQDRGRTFSDAPAGAAASGAGDARSGASRPGIDPSRPGGPAARPVAPSRISLRGVPDIGPQRADTVWPPLPTDWPLRNRYDPLEDIGALEWREANPTFDGRGVTIAMIDLSPDPLLPELQQALTIDGQVVPKIAVYRTVTDAVEEPDGRWHEMETRVETLEGAFDHEGETYYAPRDGVFRVDLLNEETFDSLSGAGLDDDLNRDENPEGSSRVFAILWDPDIDDVWVDTDQDRDFTDERVLSDYGNRPEFGVLGTDDPETPVRESVGFAVQIDQENERVGLNFGVARHASLVVGAALASEGEEGLFNGVAPGARLASVAEGGSAYGQTEAAIVAARDAGADVIFFEQSSQITRSYLLRDGRLVPTVIYGRLVEEYGVSIASPTHNYPVLGAPDDFVMAPGVIGIGGHQSADNYFHNKGTRTPHQDNLLYTGGYGPMGNGALEPDVISPSEYVSTAQGFVAGDNMDGLFELPPGYTQAGGTSTATPTAAGALGLLVSAAKQEGISTDPYRIKRAVSASARWLDHIPAYKQGNGVINVAGAWDLMKEMETAPLVMTEGSIVVRAPVRHAYSHLLPTPHEGVGLFEKEGWRAGDRGTRTVYFTRTVGPDEPMTFAVSWLGDEDGTFMSPTTMTLPLGEEVAVDVEVAPRTAGAHTAHMTLEHPDVPGYAHRMLAAVVAAEPLTAENDWTITKETEVERPGMRSFFFHVPEGADVFKVDVETEERGVGVQITGPDTRSAARVGGGPDETGTATRTVHDPMPGVWEVRLDDVYDTQYYDWEQAKEEAPVPPTPATLTVSALGVDVTVAAESMMSETEGEGGGPAAGSGATGAAQQDAPIPVAVTNRMAKTSAGVSTLPLGSAHRERVTLGEKEMRVFRLQVPAGATHLLARVTNPSDPEADLDVYVFDCTEEEGEEASSPYTRQSGGCRGVEADGDPVGGEEILVESPAEGEWAVVVDAFEAPSGSVTFQYVDVAFAPVFGTVGVADAPAERESGDTWTARANVWQAGDLPEGREPFAGVVVQAGGEGAFRLELARIR